MEGKQPTHCVHRC